MSALGRAVARPREALERAARLVGGARARGRHPRPRGVPRVELVGVQPEAAALLRGSQWFRIIKHAADWEPAGHPEGIGEGPSGIVAVVERDAEAQAHALAARRVAVATREGDDDPVWLAIGEHREAKATLAGLASQLEWRDRVAHAQRRVALEAAERAAGRPQPSVSMLVSTNRPDKVGNVLSYAARQTGVAAQLVLVSHGFTSDAEALRTAREEHPELDIVTVEADASLTLGACLNLGIDAAGGDWIVKMDDDNFYGAHFLVDLERDARLSGAAITGKAAHYVHFESTQAVVLRFPYEEHTFARLIQGGTMFLEGGFARKERFGDLPRAVDTDLLTRCRAMGLPIYSSDRFNFLSVRMPDRLAHTWTVSDASFMTGSGELQFFGDARAHVEI